MSNGYIPLYRSFFDHFLWGEEREFSKAEAWLDCIRMARFEESEAKKMINGKLIRWGYGEFPASIRFLKKRWKWKSNTKVENFLALLEQEDMVIIDKRQGQNIITLCNKRSYDPRFLDERTPKRQVEDTKRTKKGRSEDETNNNKKHNKNKEYTLLSSLSSDDFNVDGAVDEKIDWTTVRFFERAKVGREHYKNIKKATLKDWRKPIRLMHTQDKLPFKKIWAYLKFLFQDDFWSDTVYSPKGLRKNWEEIDAAMKREKKKKSNTDNKPEHYIAEKAYTD